ncbi:hypothetical protein PT974_05210 [Cladobotryum mycophilum]|uniref:N-acetyltransferase domain-containing protein n=1 Tax=Cladobotryum mycophilum TaxID=491253 RepID=A0ABR0SI31_9HYPO
MADRPNDPVTHAGNQMEGEQVTQPRLLDEQGAIRKQFTEKGAIGGLGDKVGGPIGKDSIIGKEFKSDGMIGGTIQNAMGLRPLPDPAATRTEPPNALSAISITVRPEFRSQGLAEVLILAMKQSAIDRGFDAMVVPLRPTRKAEFPRTNMTSYSSWSMARNQGHGTLKSTDTAYLNLPFDPWLWKYVRLGAKLIKVAARSMYVEGSSKDWQEWTGVNFEQLIGRKGTISKRDLDSGNLYVEATFPKGLVPLKYYVEEQRCVYLEPNIWLYHELSGSAFA